MIKVEKNHLQAAGISYVTTLFYQIIYHHETDMAFIAEVTDGALEAGSYEIS